MSNTSMYLLSALGALGLILMYIVVGFIILVLSVVATEGIHCWLYGYNFFTGE